VDNIVEFRPMPENPDAKPSIAREDVRAGQCDHRNATFLFSAYEMRVTCSKCKEPIEAIKVIQMLADEEYWRARMENAAAYARMEAEAQAEKQALKTRKAAYATLYRFGVTPEMYAEEYRRKMQFEELALKQDYNQTIPFAEASR